MIACIRMAKENGATGADVLVRVLIVCVCVCVHTFTLAHSEFLQQWVRGGGAKLLRPKMCFSRLIIFFQGSDLGFNFANQPQFYDFVQKYLPLPASSK